MGRTPAGLAGLTLAAMLAPTPGSTGDLGRDPRGFLKTDAGLTDADLQDIDRGRVVARVLDTSDRSEILSIAAMRVKTQGERVLERFRNVEARRADEEVLQIGRFSPDAPSPRDFAGLTLDQKDIDHLKRCQVSECAERLPAEAIGRFKNEVDWSSPRAAERATTLWRDLLASYAASYVARGNAGLVEYDDNKEPVRVGEALRQLLLRCYYLADSSPDLARYLLEFPGGRPPATEDVLYWLKEKFWLKSVSSLNHLVLMDERTAAGRVILAATKQLFANHYYDASLALAVFAEDPSPAGSYFVLVNRTRADVRPSGFNWIERSLLRRLVTRRLRAQFRALRIKLDPSTPPAPVEEP